MEKNGQKPEEKSGGGQAEMLRYLVFGVLTTLVNFACFYLLRDVFGAETNASNTVAVVASILFAYAVNRRYVFRSKTSGFAAVLREMVSFFAARAVTMLVEIGGVFLLHTVCGLMAYPVKIGLNVLVIILNYLFSKLIVFRKGKA